MSGTSLDGIDVALITTDGETVAEFGPSRTFPYGEDERALLRQALQAATALADRTRQAGRAGGGRGSRHHAATPRPSRRFSRRPALRQTAIDLIGFHGQTVFHDAARAMTVQIGDGQALADRLGRPVMWDLRADDVAAGGQGAPLVPAYHRALAATAGLARPGGVPECRRRRQRHVHRRRRRPSSHSIPARAARCSTIGCGGGPAGPYDSEGRLAASGTASAAILSKLLDHPYFAKRPPKSLDRDSFVPVGMDSLSDADGAATLLHFSALSVAVALKHLPAPPKAWYVCGGGRRNTELMRLLSDLLGRCAGAAGRSARFRRRRRRGAGLRLPRRARRRRKAHHLSADDWRAGAAERRAAQPAAGAWLTSGQVFSGILRNCVM